MLLDFYTFAAMDNATVYSVSSETTGHPAEHAVAPLESSFAWQANESGTQHTLVIDLGETRECDGFMFMHNETEISTPTAISTTIAVEYSSNAVDWTSAVLAYNSDGTGSPSDLINDAIRLKLRHFVDGSANLTPCVAQYWRFTVKGIVTPLEYAPADARLNAIWLFNIHQLDRGYSFPINDAITYPTNNIPLAFGKSYLVGYGVNPYRLFTRAWMVTDAEYSVLHEVMQQCNGVYRPFVFVEPDGTRRLCKFASDKIAEEVLDTNLRRVTCYFVEIPIIGKDKVH